MGTVLTVANRLALALKHAEAFQGKETLDDGDSTQ